MLVYNSTKGQFVFDVRNNLIADKILEEVRSHGLNAGQDREYNSWQNSMQFMRNIVDDPYISDDVEIAIEYNIPQTSKRVDFIIAGADCQDKDNVVIVELKQWTSAKMVSDDMHYSVRTYVANAERVVCHPSYQAYSYASFIKNYSQTVSDNTINLVPCAYLHNYQPEFRSQLDAPVYSTWINEAPFFIKNQVEDFSNFVKKYITRRASSGDLLFQIDHGRLRPTKTLQDSLVSMVMGNQEFMMIDEQAVIYDICLKIMNMCLADNQKRTIIIQGGPGTGKSVLAINLLMEFIKMSLNASYVTKNSAPRNAFLDILTHSDARRRVTVSQLFRSPFGLSSCPENSYDCLIVDEAHRLVAKMYGDWNGENQVKECINASLLTIFMLDENQAITTKDIGTVSEIRKWCNELGSQMIMNDETKLISQFRCNGSDSYIQFLNNVLQVNSEIVPIKLSELNYEFKVFDSPVDMRNALREKNMINNKSRMVAGYCYDWNVKNNRGDIDISLPGGFEAKWNLAGDNIWAINPNSFEEVGCIHTAQGLEFDYVGVLIGKDLAFDNKTGRICTNRNAISRDDKSSGIRSCRDELFAHRLIINTYKTLMTRGQKGCYVYCEDQSLREYLKGLSMQ